MAAWEATMTLRIGKRSNARPRGRAAFTLIELILVMTVLVIVIAVTFPGLNTFFKGRTMESEGRRFLTLARYGQNRAVTEGIPMTLWIDAHEGTYGLEAQNGFLDRDDRAVDYTIDEKLELEVKTSTLNRAQLSQEQQYRRRNLSASRNALPEIRFSPDGSIDVLSPQSIGFRMASDNSKSLWITQSDNRLGYEVETNRR
jgi:prepilin-type N-terminal cleavage/methylation domain-containing protein